MLTKYLQNQTLQKFRFQLIFNIREEGLNEHRITRSIGYA